MAKPIVSDELWEIVELLIPKVERRRRYPGRKRIPDRKVLTGILFVLRTGIPWEDLLPGDGSAARGSPAGAGSGSGKSRACGRGCTRCSWRRSTLPIRSTGSGPRSTPPACGPLGWRAHRAEPSRPPKTELQAPRPRLRAGHPARRADLGRQRQRHHEAHPRGRRRAAGARRELRRRKIKTKVARPNDPHGSGLGRRRGWSSGRSPGFTSTGACASATSVAPTSTKRS